MADPDEPKRAGGQPNEPKPAAPADAGEDPLAELVRVMSARLVFDPAPLKSGKTVPVAGAVSAAVARAKDLQARLRGVPVTSRSISYPPRRPPLAPAPSAPVAKPVVPVPEPPVPARPEPKARAASAPTPRAAGSAPAAAPAAPASVPRPDRAAIRNAEGAAAGDAVSRRSEKASPPSVLTDRPNGPAPAATAATPTTIVDPARAASEKPELAASPHPSAERDRGSVRRAAGEGFAIALPPSTTAVPALKPSGRRARPADPRQAQSLSAAPEPSRLAPPRRGSVRFRPSTAVSAPPPQLDEGSRAALAAANDEPDDERAPERKHPGVLALHGEDDGELPQIAEGLGEAEHHPLRRGLVLGGALLVLVAAGAAYVMMRSKQPAATPPAITADASAAKVAPGANGERSKRTYDRVDSAGNADQTAMATPSDTAVATALASSSGDDNMQSLLTKLGYYTGPEQDEKESVTLARAFTTWLFHHDLPAATPVSNELIARMQADLAKGDIRPSILPNKSRKSALPATWTQKDCQESLAAATKLRSGPIKGVNVSGDGRTVEVGYDEAEWRGKTDAEKMTVVDLVNCALAGPGEHVASLEIRGFGTNRLLAQWSGGKGLEATGP